MLPNSGQSSMGGHCQSIKAIDVPCTPMSPPPPVTNSRRFWRSRGSVKRIADGVIQKDGIELLERFALEDGGIFTDGCFKRTGLPAHERERLAGVRPRGAMSAVADVAREDQQPTRLGGLDRRFRRQCLLDQQALVGIRDIGTGGRRCRRRGRGRG